MVDSQASPLAPCDFARNPVWWIFQCLSTTTTTTTAAAAAAAARGRALQLNPSDKEYGLSLKWLQAAGTLLVRCHESQLEPSRSIRRNERAYGEGEGSMKKEEKLETPDAKKTATKIKSKKSRRTDESNETKKRLERDKRQY